MLTVMLNDAEATIVAVKYTRDAFHMAATYGEYKNHVNINNYVGGADTNGHDSRNGLNIALTKSLKVRLCIR